MGCAVNAGFMFLRAGGRKAQVARLIEDATKRGLIEFYLRWNNIVDQYGFSFVIESSGVRPHTTEFTNEVPSVVSSRPTLPLTLALALTTAYLDADHAGHDQALGLHEGERRRRQQLPRCGLPAVAPPPPD